MERERDLVVSGLFHRYLVGLGHPRAEQRETAVDELRRLRKLGRFADWVCRDRARAGVTLQQVFVILDLSRRHLDTGEIRALQATVHQYDCITRKRIRGVPPQARELLRDLQPEIDREH